MTLDELNSALAPRYRAADLGGYVQLIDAEGHHLALAVLSPLTVQVDLAVVFMDPSLSLEEGVPEAHSMLDDHFKAHFESLGFKLGDEGALVEAEVVGDRDTIITSWERPMTTEPASLAALVSLLDEVRAMDTELVL